MVANLKKNMSRWSVFLALKQIILRKKRRKIVNDDWIGDKVKPNYFCYKGVRCAFRVKKNKTEGFGHKVNN